MICSLNSLKKSLKKECRLKVLQASEPDLQMFLDRLGITLKEVMVKSGPWGSFILTFEQQEIALGPSFAQSLQVEI